MRRGCWSSGPASGVRGPASCATCRRCSSPAMLLVFNDTKVIPAQLERHAPARRRGRADRCDAAYAHRRRIAGRPSSRPAKRLAVGDRISFGHDGNACFLGTLDATVVEKGEAGEVTLAFDLAGAVARRGAARGRPYSAAALHRLEARRTTSATAPTTRRSMPARRARSPRRRPGCISRRSCLPRSTSAASSAHFVTLHVGAGTFLPVKADDTADHRMHAESGTIVGSDGRRAERRTRARRAHRRGRHHLAAAAGKRGARRTARSRAWSGATDIFITPGYRFRAVDVLMTNFHLPRSTLFMLVSAFCGLETMRAAYAHAIDDRLPLLFLWRCQPAVPERRSMTDEFRLHACSRPTARRGAARSPCRAARSARRPSCRSAPAARSRRCIWTRCAALGADIILGNTYHLMLRPGAERVARLGGLHEFARWPHPILTDSGGFQVMSLSQLRKLDENGVTFRSHIDGARLRDDAGALDRDPGPARFRHPDAARRMRRAAGRATSEIERAMELSLRWAERCKTAFGDQPGKAMFGIVQGGDVPALRERSAAGAERHGPQGLCGRRAGGRRAAGGDARHARRRPVRACRPTSRAI